MNCNKCGSPITENDQFCKNCGAINAQGKVIDSQQYQQNNQSNMMQMQQMNNQQYQQTNQSNMMQAQQMNNQQYQQQNYTNNSQINWNDGYKTMQNQQPPSNNNLKYVLIGIAIVVVLSIFFFIANALKGNSNDSGYIGNSGSNTPQPLPTNTTNRPYKVRFKGFNFTIPGDLVCEEDNGILLIGDEAGTWMAQFEIGKGSFSQLKSNKNQLQTIMQQNGYNCTAAVEKTLGGVEFITMEATLSGQKIIMALTKANAAYFMGVTAINRDNEIDYKILETVAPIISSAESISTGTNNLSVNTKIDMNGFAGLAQK